MMELNPGAVFSPVAMEIFSSAGRVLVFLIAVLAQVYLIARIRKAFRRSRRSLRVQAIAAAAAGTAVLCLFALGGYVIAAPVTWVDPPRPLQLLLFYLPAIWCVGSISSALILLFFQGAGGLQRRAARIRQDLTGRPVEAPVDAGRRRFLQAGAGALAVAPFVLSGYGAAYAGRAYEVREIAVPFGRSLRVVQLTDIHAGLTGDYITNSAAFLPECLEEMARVSARYGTFASLGNHDHWYAAQGGLTAMFRHYRIPLLRNAHRVLRTPEGPFAVAGIDDLIAGRPDLDAALRGLTPALPTILLSHRPEIFPEAAGKGVELTLSGHYHGGQIKLELPRRALSVAHLRTPYPEGLYRIDGAHLYVSRGIGTSLTPVRLNARPEVTVLNLS